MTEKYDDEEAMEILATTGADDSFEARKAADEVLGALAALQSGRARIAKDERGAVTIKVDQTIVYVGAWNHCPGFWMMGEHNRRQQETIPGLQFNATEKRWEGVAYDDGFVVAPGQRRRRRSALAVIVDEALKYEGPPKSST